MRVKLNKKWIDFLVSLPESGMGYQRVVISFVDGSELKDILVFNSEEAELPEDFSSKEISQIQLIKE